MIKTIVRDRGTGKTTEIIIRMRENKNLITLVQSHMVKENLYPKDLQKRVFTIGDIMNDKSLLKGVKFEKILIDEGFIFHPVTMAKLYYYLGNNNIAIDVYGSVSN